MESVIDQPFNLEITLECGQGHRWRQANGNDGWYESVVGDSMVRIRQKGDIHDSRNFVEFLSPWADAKAEAFLRWHFRLDDQIEDIYADLSNRDPIVAELVDRYRGLRVMRISPWECLVFFILSVRSPICRTKDNIERLSRGLASPLLVNLDDSRRLAFPDARDVARTGLGKLKELLVGLPDYGPRVKKAGEAVSSGRIDFDALAQTPCSQTVSELRRLRGVGHKVANCVALFSLEKPEAFPIDTHIHNALKRLYGYVAGLPAAKSPESPSLRRWIQERFPKYAGYASQFLFIDQYRSTRPQG